MVACEVLIATPAIRNLIREGKVHQIYSSMQAGGRFGMQTMDMSLAQHVKSGRITQQMAFERCHDAEELTAAGRRCQQPRRPNAGFDGGGSIDMGGGATGGGGMIMGGM